MRDVAEIAVFGDAAVADVLGPVTSPECDEGPGVPYFSWDDAVDPTNCSCVGALMGGYEAVGDPGSVADYYGPIAGEGS